MSKFAEIKKHFGVKSKFWSKNDLLWSLFIKILNFLTILSHLPRFPKVVK